VGKPHRLQVQLTDHLVADQLLGLACMANPVSLDCAPSSCTHAGQCCFTLSCCKAVSTSALAEASAVHKHDFEVVDAHCVRHLACIVSVLATTHTIPNVLTHYKQHALEDRVPAFHIYSLCDVMWLHVVLLHGSI